jgi:hypothetical protein
MSQTRCTRSAPSIISLPMLMPRVGNVHGGLSLSYCQCVYLHFSRTEVRDAFLANRLHDNTRMQGNAPADNISRCMLTCLPQRRLHGWSVLSSICTLSLSDYNLPDLTFNGGTLPTTLHPPR